LAACAQVGGPIQSTFRWQEQMETSEEWVCLAKTDRHQLPAIEQLLAELHPYEVPELIATPIVAGGAAYLKWMAEQLGAEER
jgi:periplasmic divalent cation tolerance protein